MIYIYIYIVPAKEIHLCSLDQTKRAALVEVFWRELRCQGQLLRQADASARFVLAGYMEVVPQLGALLGFRFNVLGLGPSIWCAAGCRLRSFQHISSLTTVSASMQEFLLRFSCKQLRWLPTYRGDFCYSSGPIVPHEVTHHQRNDLNII